MIKASDIKLFEAFLYLYFSVYLFMKNCSCEGCTYPVFSHLYCQRHQSMRTDDKWLKSLERKASTIINPVSNKSSNSLKRTSLKQKFTKPTGELQLFREIWQERKHVSEISGQPLGEFSVYMFSHILTKGAYPTYRLVKENIKLVTPEEHDMWEFHRDKIKENPLWEWVFVRYDELRYEYYNS